jgi:hypothetical protein
MQEARPVPVTAECPFGSTEEKSAWQAAQPSVGVCELDAFAEAAGLNTRHSNTSVIRDVESILAVLIPATV